MLGMMHNSKSSRIKIRKAKDFSHTIAPAMHRAGARKREDRREGFLISGRQEEIGERTASFHSGWTKIHRRERQPVALALVAWLVRCGIARFTSRFSSSTRWYKSSRLLVIMKASRLLSLTRGLTEAILGAWGHLVAAAAAAFTALVNHAFTELLGSSIDQNNNPNSPDEKLKRSRWRST